MEVTPEVYEQKKTELLPKKYTYSLATLGLYTTARVTASLGGCYRGKMLLVEDATEDQEETEDT